MHIRVCCRINQFCCNYEAYNAGNNKEKKQNRQLLCSSKTKGVMKVKTKLKTYEQRKLYKVRRYVSEGKTS